MKNIEEIYPDHLTSLEITNYLAKWCIEYTVDCLNKVKHEYVDDFRFMGLNNTDFITTDFYSGYICYGTKIGNLHP